LSFCLIDKLIEGPLTGEVTKNGIQWMFGGETRLDDPDLF